MREENTCFELIYRLMLVSILLKPSVMLNIFIVLSNSDIPAFSGEEFHCVERNRQAQRKILVCNQSDC